MSGKVTNTIVTDGLVRYWDLANEKCYNRIGTSAQTLAYAKNPGIIPSSFPAPDYVTNNGQLVLDFPNGSFSQDGVGCIESGNGNATIGINGDADTQLTEKYTISVWIKLTFLPGDVAGQQIQLISFGQGLPLTLDIVSSILDATEYRFTTGILTIGDLIDPSPVTIDKWYNVAVTYENNIPISIMYVDGQSVANSTVSQPYYIQGQFTILLGSSGTGETIFKLSSFALYDRALTPDEVLQNYKAHKNRFGL